MTAALVIGGVAGLVSKGSGGFASHASAAYLFLVALFTGSGAYAVARGGSQAMPPAAAPQASQADLAWPGPVAGDLVSPGFTPQDPEPAEPAAPAETAEPAEPAAPAETAWTADPAAPAETAWTERDLRHGRNDTGTSRPARPRPAGPPVNPQAHYSERCSNLPVTGAVIGIALLAAGLAGLVAIGGPNGKGAGASGAIYLLLALVSAVYVLFMLIDLPNGIRVGDGRFAVGVRGVPPAGRMWRRIAGPLDAVRSWEVLSPAQAKQLRQQRIAERKAGRRRQYLGDLRLFGRRGAVRLRVDMAAVQASLPARILVGYAFVQASSAGAVWDGTVIIGTRHGAALAAALQQALPGRQAAPASGTGGTT